MIVKQLLGGLWWLYNFWMFGQWVGGGHTWSISKGFDYFTGFQAMLLVSEELRSFHGVFGILTSNVTNLFINLLARMIPCYYCR